MKEKLQSKVVWLSVIAIVVGLVAHYNPSVSEEIDIIATAVVTILTLFGVLNNPNDREAF